METGLIITLLLANLTATGGLYWKLFDISGRLGAGDGKFQALEHRLELLEQKHETAP